MASNNTLRFTDTATGAQTLTLTNPSKDQSLDFLATANNLGTTFSVTLNYADGTSSAPINSAITTGQWAFGTAPSNEAYGGSQTFNYGGSINSSWPFFLTESDITVPNTSETIDSITFTPTFPSGKTGTADIYAVSGQVYAPSQTLTSQTYANTVSVTANSSIDVSGSLAATMGSLSIGSNKLSVTSADASGNAFSLTLGAITLSGNATFDVAASTGGGAGTLNLGSLNDGGTARTLAINPTGSGSVTLGSAATSLVTGTVINIQGGTLNSNITAAIGSAASVNLASPGVFNVGAKQTISALNGSTGSVTLGGNTLTIGSTDGLSSNFGGAITGTGAISIGSTGVGGGAVTLGGASTYSGGASIQDGTLVLAGSTTTTAGAITSGPAGTGMIALGAGSGVVASQLLVDGTAGRTIANNISVTSGNTANNQVIGGLNTSGVSTFSGNVTLGTGGSGDFGHNLTLAATSGGEVDFTGNIVANLNTAHSMVTVTNLSGTGSATVKVFGNNTYSGGTVINTNVTYASALSPSTTTLGSNTVTVAGGTLALEGQETHGSQQTIGLTGFNQSLIVPASATTAASATSTTIDGGNVLYQSGFSPSDASGYSEGLNASGLYTSQYNPGVQFQLAPYNGNTALQVSTTHNTDTLTLAAPGAFSTLNILSTGHGSSPVSISLNFATGPSVSETLTAQDWYFNGSQSRVAIGGNGADAIGSAQRNPDAATNYPAALYEDDFTLSATDQSRTLESVTFTDTTGSANIFAISGSSYVVPSINSTQTYANDVSVTANSDIDVSGSLNAIMGSLSMGGNTLSVSSMDHTTNAYSLTLGYTQFQGSSDTFNVASSAGGGAGTLVLGSLDDQGASQTITKSGAGTLTLSAPATSLVNGTVFDITGGTLNSNDSNATGGYAIIDVGAGATFGIGADQAIGSLADYLSPGVNSSTVALNGHTLTVGTITDASSTFSGKIVDGAGSPGSGGFIKAGLGTLTLLGASTYSGATTVSLGTLLAMNASGSATGTGAVGVTAANQAFLGGTGTIAGAVTVHGNGNIFAGTEDNTPGEVAGALHIGTGSALTGTTLLDITAVNSADEIVIGSGTGAVTFGGILKVNNPNSVSFAMGQDYDLLDFGSHTSTFGTVNLPALSGGLAWDTSHLYTNGASGGYIDIIAAGPTGLVWDDHLSSSGDGITWDNGTTGTSQNWNAGGTPAFFTQGAAVTFNDANNGNYTVNLASNVLPSSVTVNSAGPYVFQSTGGFTIRDYTSPTTLTQSGGGSLTIENPNTFTGATSVSGTGTYLHLTSTGTLATSQLTVAAGSSAQIDGLLTGTPAIIANGNINLGAADGHNDPAAGLLARSMSSLTIGSGVKVTVAAGAASTATVLTLGSLSDSGTMDLNNGEMIINYGSGPDPIASIAALIADGAYGSGTTVTWTGTGITSSQARTNPSYGLGYADSADPANPAKLASGTIEVIYTLLGDANLDGKVNGTDFNLMAANFNQSVTAGWDKGDFNYDGKVNGNDFVLLADNFNQFASQSAAVADIAALDSFAAANGISLASVPEPAYLGLLTLGAVGMLARRRRSNRSVH